MFWIILIGIIIVASILSPSSGSSTNSRGNNRNNARNDGNEYSAPQVKTLQKNEAENKLNTTPKVETYEEKHQRINKAIEEARRQREAERQRENEIKCEITSEVKQNRETDLLIPFENSNYVSTTQLGKIYGVKARPELFKYLVDHNYLIYEDKKYKVTSKAEPYAGYKKAEKDGSIYAVWNIKLTAPIIQDFLKSKLTNLTFNSLFHLTHLNNLASICEENLKCHSKMYAYTDVSNTDVNRRREKLEPCFGNKIHDYVPFYFNVKNAMLYAVQKNFGNKVIILEVSRDAICLPYTIFSDRNAAANDSQITEIKDETLNFVWSEIYATQWTENRVQNYSRKQFMMAECLIFNTVPNEFIKTIHCQNSDIHEKVLNTVKQYRLDIEVKITPHLFF